MVIREYRFEDLNAVAAIMDQGRKQELANVGLERYAVPFKQAPYFSYFFEANVFVAEIDQKVVGVVSFTTDNLGFLYVSKALQGKGIGGKLLDFALEKMNRPATINVFTKNVTAQKLYQSRGFKLVGRIRDDWDGTQFEEDKLELE
ncbi:GNAT family N-acetyltransferase [Lactobacillus gigeriorum]|uniref:N-acetyltransferase domain-containing protein n=1 Tax=Lactobacillus gigeriorum DSM 23908 = CRBIP 24.85 TaxID=1423751 RepID=I7KP53_9LACO|nr:GNAT family N-acetyltransferase [Lactobacillus gigeriorum]KRN09747.1 hypothetical protein FC38_GL001362 [Lactobacillus gigeriorum DSM 23908 = CRBIP 24.85]CCI87139.1 Putative uncharacterized protein [Lactobacillus gigeriorum DSM 23908 = CRBIP 24.85]